MVSSSQRLLRPPVVTPQMHGMEALRTIMSQRPLRVRAYPLDDSPSSTNNSKTVHFIRHGQGFHNLLADQASAQGRTWQQFVVSPDNPYTLPEILDAPLTHKGRQQALALRSRVPDGVELVVVSPNCRALQTALLATSSTHDAPVVAHEMCREECGVHICDQRRPIAQQRLDFPTVDFSLLTDDDDEDPLWSPDRRETKEQVGERGYAFLEWLEQRPEQHIVVASHSGWLLTLFNGVLECHRPTTTAAAPPMRSQLLDWWQTGELRSVRLEFVRTHSAA